MRVIGFICVLSTLCALSWGRPISATDLAVRSNEVNGTSEADGTCTQPGKTLTYEFAAGPGDVSVQVAGRPAGGWFEHRFGANDWCYTVTFNERTSAHQHGQPLATIAVPAPSVDKDRNTPKDISLARTFKIRKKINISMTLKLAGHFDYRIELGGAVATPPRPIPPDPK